MSRDHEISTDGKYSGINGSADPIFLGDKTRYNPEDLFLSSLSACHMLWYLHLCATHKIIVTSYSDNASGTLVESENGGGRFTEVTLNPKVKIKDATLSAKAMGVYREADKMCFIANSCNCKIKHQPDITAD
ncbi:OsmC family protein [Cryomorpha ignava]|uniref:OsmC family protein n=1 Tax=Cryomorpha ignava TaxID=101383 RepID=UPI00293BDC19|nr:OsmC family protein [Cryomorpha ignava]